jgi:hypothetical protein
MSSTTTRARYDFHFYIEVGDSTAEGGFTLTSSIGVDDTLALAIADAFNSQQWPTGITRPMTVSKADVVETAYTTSQSPPDFN